nr:PREDICTED: tumor suppressor candidate 5 homolog [Anolis carolinensis]|eukprot:XP_008115497.1 PREDICTED: tumor suppressor candidate 5 homolog [Anolis carolinensis]
MYGKQPLTMPDSLQPLPGSAPALGYGATLPMPPQYQPYYVPPGPGFSPGPSIQPSHSIIIPTVQHTEAPDYLIYSIFTSICCCIPLGMAAVYYSVLTRKANRLGDFAASQKYSSLARNLAHTAMGVGLFFIVLSIIIVMSVLHLAFGVSEAAP